MWVRIAEQTQGCGPLNVAAGFALGQERYLWQVGVSVSPVQTLLTRGEWAGQQDRRCTVIQLGSLRSQPGSGRKESGKEGKALSTTACLFQPRRSLCPVSDITLLLDTFLLTRF